MAFRFNPDGIIENKIPSGRLGKNFTPVEHPEGSRFNGAGGAGKANSSKQKNLIGQPTPEVYTPREGGRV
jgi:hypothetical protein